MATVSIVGKINPSCRTPFSLRECVDVQLEVTLRIFQDKPKAHRVHIPMVLQAIVTKKPAKVKGTPNTTATYGNDIEGKDPE